MILAVSSLLETVSGSIITFLLGIQSFPSLMSIIGMTITLYGLYLIIKGKEETEEIKR
jgi:hypothetical protein